MVHIFECVVHDPNPIRLSQNYFKKPPNKVTDGNKCFWSKNLEVGGSICKKCWNKFANQKFYKTLQVDILPNDTNVCIYLYYSFLESRVIASSRCRTISSCSSNFERFITLLFTQIPEKEEQKVKILQIRNKKQRNIHPPSLFQQRHYSQRIHQEKEDHLFWTK